MTRQRSEQQFGECLSRQERDFVDTWRRLVDRAGGPAKVVRVLRWGKSTVYRNYGGQYLPSDEWVGQLCRHLELPDQEVVDLLGLWRRAREARQARQVEAVSVVEASDEPGSHEIEQYEPEVARGDAAGVVESGEQRDGTVPVGSPRSRRMSRRIIAAVIAVVVIATPLGWWWYKTTHGSQVKCQSFGRATFALVIPVSCLSPALAAGIGQGQRTTAATVTGFVFANGADSLCLSANTAGPLAGDNRDKVQLANCSFAAEEIWIPVERRDSGGESTWLVNYRYQSKCLNADSAGGLREGNHVQLWDCYDAANEYWDFNGWYVKVGQGSHPSPIRLGSSKLCLDADKYDLGEGDRVLVWPAYGGSNQLWSSVY